MVCGISGQIVTVGMLADCVLICGDAGLCFSEMIQAIGQRKMLTATTLRHECFTRSRIKATPSSRIDNNALCCIMYLSTVLQQINSSKTYLAEDLYKLNEAMFNLPEEDVIDNKITLKLFQAVSKIVKAYNSEKYDTDDPNFFYDYVALLGTMQNQHFFSTKQNTAMLGWLAEATGGSSSPPPPPPKVSAATAKEMASLEAENKKLQAEIEKLKVVADAVNIIKTFKAPSPPEAPKAKAKAKVKKEQKERKPKVKKEEAATEVKAATEEKAATEVKAATEEKLATEEKPATGEKLAAAPAAERPAETVAEGVPIEHVLPVVLCSSVVCFSFRCGPVRLLSLLLCVPREVWKTHVFSDTQIQERRIKSDSQVCI